MMMVLRCSTITFDIGLQHCTAFLAVSARRCTAKACNESSVQSPGLTRGPYAQPSSEKAQEGRRAASAAHWSAFEGPQLSCDIASAYANRKFFGRNFEEQGFPGWSFCKLSGASMHAIDSNDTKCPNSSSYYTLQAQCIKFEVKGQESDARDPARCGATLTFTCFRRVPRVPSQSCKGWTRSTGRLWSGKLLGSIASGADCTSGIISQTPWQDVSAWQQ